MNRIRTLLVFAGALLVGLPGAFAERETIDFEALPEGTVVDEAFSREGSGPVLVGGSNERFVPGHNAAIIYDSSCPDGGTPADCSGEDADLGTPHEGFGGPGRGAAGGPFGRYPNSIALGKVLIVAEEMTDADGDGLIDDPDDEGALRHSRVELDFSEIGPVTLHSLSVLEIKYGDEPASIDLFDEADNLLGQSPFILPDTDGNGAVFEYSLDDTEGVSRMVVRLRGSGAIDNIVFSREGPRIDIETLTNGAQADLVDGEDVPWIRVGQPVTWTYVVTNTGTVELSGIEVEDDRLVEVGCPRDELAPGESMECTAGGISLDLQRAELGIPTVKGRCLSRGGRPLYRNTGSASAKGPEGLAVADTDPSHYCADSARPDLYVRKQEKGPDTQSVASGSVATFEIVVWNRGTEDLRDIKVADVLAPDCNRELSRLAAGKNLSYTCSAPALAIGGDGVTGCSFVNEVVATGRGDKETVTDSDTSTVELLALDIGKSFIGASTEAANFEIMVTNNGCDLDRVQVTDPLAPDCERDLGALAAGDSRNYTCSMPLVNEACAEGLRGETTAGACDTAAFVVTIGGFEMLGEVDGVDEVDEVDEGGEVVGDAVDTSDAAAGEESGGDGGGRGSSGLLLLLLAVLVGGGLFAWNRMKAG